MPKFVVHEHHAKRLHFDFRLEMEGVLKSWAVPKGPSMDPADKRLAVMVDDHAIDYIDFEGIIPEGMYGAGEVLIWDSGSYQRKSGDLASGKLEFSMKGRVLKGDFVLTRMSGRQKDWLLFKKRDEFAIPGFKLQQVKNS